MSTKPETTMADVKTVANELMDKNGSTTTLDVKNELRSTGFWATQKTVSQYMEQLQSIEGWHYDANGVHRVYSKTPITTTDDEDEEDKDDVGTVKRISDKDDLLAFCKDISDDKVKVASGPPIPPPIPHCVAPDGSIVPPITIPAGGKRTVIMTSSGLRTLSPTVKVMGPKPEWVAYKKDKSLISFYPGDWTRDKARYAFAKKLGMKKDEIRAHRRTPT